MKRAMTIAAAAFMLAASAPAIGQATGGVQSVASPSAPASSGSAVHQAPMNSVMRQAMGGSAAEGATSVQPVQSTPTNAMTLTLRPDQSQQGASAADGGGQGATTGGYDAYGIRNPGGQGATSGSQQQSQSGPQAPAQ